MVESRHIEIEAPAIELIAQLVITALRADLEAIAAELAMPHGPAAQLTVDQVAQRLGVARSTVYAHWREWGGYKLGPSDKAPIRFDSVELPVGVAEREASRPTPVVHPARTGARKRRRRDLLVGAPRLAATTEELG